MKYDNIIEGTFISRPNRFIAKVLINGTVETVHVKNTGRCKELLVEGANVFLSCENKITRKTKYDLISVIKSRNINDSILINMDSQIVNDVAEEWLNKSLLFSENAKYFRERKFGNSRFDFYVEDGNRKAFLEVKGVTLEREGVASFPDAPTERGIKHLNELCKCIEEDYEAYILFVIQMKGVNMFVPERAIHKDFADALSRAKNSGVNIICLDCIVTPDEIVADGKIPFDI